MKKTKPNDARQHVRSRLMRQSLLDKQVMQSTESPVFAMLPFLNVIKIGGRSIIDHGRAVLYPLVEEIGACLRQHKMAIGVGAGIRSRHIFGVGLDLGLPTGVLAQLSAADALQNAHIIGTLLAPYGVSALPLTLFGHLLPAFLAACPAIVFNGVPPYDLWEHPPSVGKIPPHRTDAGAFLVAEAFGARTMIYLKDEDGLYTADPKKDSQAKLIRKARAQEVLDMDLKTLSIERVVFKLLTNARLVKSIQIINGRKPGLLTRALNGEHVGTIITR